MALVVLVSASVAPVDRLPWERRPTSTRGEGEGRSNRHSVVLAGRHTGKSSFPTYLIRRKRLRQVLRRVLDPVFYFLVSVRFFLGAAVSTLVRVSFSVRFFSSSPTDISKRVYISVYFLKPKRSNHRTRRPDRGRAVLDSVFDL